MTSSPCTASRSTSLNCSLAFTLGLRPLDRELINSSHEIREARAFSRFMDKPQDLSWFYFQRVVGQQLEVRSPGVIVFEIYLNMLVGSDQYCPPHNSIQHIELPTLLDGFLAAFLEEFAVLW